MSNHFMELDLNRSVVRELIDECPAGEELPECPLRRFRNLSAAEKAELFGKFTRKIIDDIFDLHQQCLANRKGLGF